MTEQTNAELIAEARDRYSMPWHETADYGYAKERADFDRMIEAVRAEEREREPSDAAVEAAARAMAHADVTNPDGWVMSEEARNVYRDMVRAALIASQEVRDVS